MPDINTSRCCYIFVRCVVKIPSTQLEMSNKLVPWVLSEPVPVLSGNFRIDRVWVWGIPAIIHVPAKSPFPFKLLKYSQLIK